MVANDTKIRHLVVGMGEVGTAIANVLKEKDEVYTRDILYKKVKIFKSIDAMHIAFPYSDRFVDSVRDYMERYNPNLVIIYSTVPIGTCEQISYGTVHSPIEGKHPYLEESIKLSARWLGCSDDVALDMAALTWLRHTNTVRTVQSSRHTEFLKLRSTSKYGVNLAWTEYESKIAKDIGMGFEAIKGFDEDYNDTYESLGLPQNKRYILDAPQGVIGGHCVVPNAEILDAQYPNQMLKEIIKLKRKKK